MMCDNPNQKTTGNKMNNIKNRIDFSGIIGVKLGNPGGDPMDENQPRRVGNSDIGIISDVCIKHKMRMVIHEKYEGQEGQNIFVLPTDYDQRSLAARIAVFKGDAEKICEHFYDVRAFGAVLIDSNNSSKESVPEEDKSAKKKAKKSTSKVLGPVSVSHAVSFDPIEITRMQISRCAIQKDSDVNDGQKSTFGTKFVVSEAYYKFSVSVNARLVPKTGFSAKDVAILEDALINLFIVDASAARPAGSMWIDSMYKIEHTSTDGSESVTKVSNRHTKESFDQNGLDATVKRLV